ncbi:hypothetical protein C8R45DRAFT_1081675 [Mycena sanguinolenta]|nr:hypothetical protein C8R45DRAFT_1081675 [Mycena sanguinolenta]
MLAQASTPATVNIPLAPYPPPQPPGPPSPPHRTIPPPSRAKKTPSTCVSSGSGPAGQSAAIRLSNPKLETSPMRWTDSSLEWRTAYPDHPLARLMTSLGMRLLVEYYVILIPHPPQMHNEANDITSPSSVVAWLGDIREEMGVEVYCATQFLFSPPSPTRKTRRAGRANANLRKHAVAMYDLRHEKEAQMYGIAVKQAWHVEEEKHVPSVRRTSLSLPSPFRSLFFPLVIPFYSTPRGQSTSHPRLDALRTQLGWEYHMANGLVSISIVVGLDYKNQYIESKREFQRTKHHSTSAPSLRTAPAAYGARALTRGGLLRLDFPGGALVGCAASVVNTAKIKGTHDAVRIPTENQTKYLNTSDTKHANTREQRVNLIIYSKRSTCQKNRAGLSTQRFIFRGEIVWTVKNMTERKGFLAFNMPDVDGLYFPQALDIPHKFLAPCNNHVSRIRQEPR